MESLVNLSWRYGESLSILTLNWSSLSFSSSLAILSSVFSQIRLFCVGNKSIKSANTNSSSNATDTLKYSVNSFTTTFLSTVLILVFASNLFIKSFNLSSEILSRICFKSSPTTSTHSDFLIRSTFLSGELPCCTSIFSIGFNSCNSPQFGILKSTI